MAKKKGKSGKIKVRHTEENRLRRIETEVKKCEKKMTKLLQRNEDGKKGIVPGGERHKRLQDHIKFLKSKI